MTQRGAGIKHSKLRGEWAELCFMVRAAEHGLRLSKPWGECAHYDFVVEAAGRFLRVQVKSTTTKRRNGYVCAVRDCRGNAYADGAFDFLAYLLASGEWQRRLFLPSRDTWNAIDQFAYYVRFRSTPPPTDFYNGLQRLAYSSAILFGFILVLSGLAIYKPVQLHWLTLLFGGYDSARVVHLGVLCALALFVASHLVLVAIHPRAILDMITGGKRE